MKMLLRLVTAAASLLSSSALALIMVGNGDPVTDAGWPAGALAVANLKSRVSWWEGPPFGGGQSNFLYRGDDAAFAETLAAFAAIRAPALDLVIHDGAGESPFLEGKAGYDWSFTVWVPTNWNHLYNNPKSVFGADQPQFRQPVDPPRLDLFVRGGSVDFSKVRVPPNVRLKDERAAAAGVNLTGGGVVRADFYDMSTGKPVAGAHLIVSRLAGGNQNQARGYPVSVYAVVGDAISDARRNAEALYARSLIQPGETTDNQNSGAEDPRKSGKPTCPPNATCAPAANVPERFDVLFGPSRTPHLPLRRHGPLPALHKQS